MSDILMKFWGNFILSIPRSDEADYLLWSRERNKIYRLIHEAANAVGAHRYFINKNGRKYLMFNAREAELVCQYIANTGLVDISIEDAKTDDSDPELEVIFGA